MTLLKTASDGKLLNCLFLPVMNGFGFSTCKSVSEALILESVNPQYDERLFIEFPEKYKFTTFCVLKNIVLNVKTKTKKNNFCTQHVVNLYFSLAISWVN